MERGSFMKRILPFLLIAFLVSVHLLPFLAVPAEAESISSDIGNNAVELLDFGPAEGYQSNFQYINANEPKDFKFFIPDWMWLRYFDITYRSYSSLSLYYVNPNNGAETLLTSNSVFSNFYRASAENGWRTSYLTIRVKSTTSNWIEFLSIKGVPFYNTGATVPATLGIKLDDGRDLGSISYTSTSGPVYKIWTGQNAYEPFLASISISNTEWKKYDFLELKSLMKVGQITSVIAYLGSDVVPLDVNFFSDSSIDINYFYLSLSLDLTSVNRNSTLPLTIEILGNEYIGSCSASIIASTGFLDLSDFDSYLYYLRNIFNTAKSGFSDVIDSIGSNSDKIVDALNSAFGSTGVGETIKQESQNQSNKIDTALGGLDSEDPPDISSIQDAMDYTGIISPDIISNSTTFLMAMFDVPLIYKISMLGLMFALVATVLFGKR